MQTTQYYEGPEIFEVHPAAVYLLASINNLTASSSNAVIAIREAVNSSGSSSFDLNQLKVASRNALKKATDNHVPMIVRTYYSCQYIYQRQGGHTD